MGSGGAVGRCLQPVGSRHPLPDAVGLGSHAFRECLAETVATADPLVQGNHCRVVKARVSHRKPLDRFARCDGR